MNEEENEEENELEKKYELILNHCYNDFISQDSRKNNVDTKTSYLLIITVFILGILLDYTILNKIIGSNFWKNGNIEIIFRIILILCYIADIVLCLISTCFLVNVLINKKYTKIKTELWNIEDIDNATYLDIMKGLIENYSSATKENTNVNNRVLRNYKIGTILLMISIFFTAIIYLIISFF